MIQDCGFECRRFDSGIQHKVNPYKLVIYEDLLFRKFYSEAKTSGEATLYYICWLIVSIFTHIRGSQLTTN